MLVSGSLSFASFACLVSLVLQAATATTTPMQKWSSIKYSTVIGFFAQDLPGTDDSTFDYISSNFGLLDNFQLQTRDLELGDVEERDIYGGRTSKPKWGKFQEAINKLNREAPKNVEYKVMYLARHGEGYHNVAESFYGTPLWDCYWSLLDGNGTSRWDDAKLTAPGVVEAQKANKAWKQQIKNGAPMPQSFYSSPLSRAAATLDFTWGDITLNKKDYPKPIIKEKLRETLGIHTCDRRAPKCEIARAFPKFTFEKGFTDGLDPLWDPVHREPDDAKFLRLKAALDEIVTSDDSTYITVSAHSGAIGSLLQVIGHRKFKIQTGGMIPVVIKVEFSKEVEKQTTVSPSGVAPRCTIDPTPAAGH